MSYYRNNHMPEYAAYGGVLSDEAYGRANGGVPYEEAYGKKKNVNSESENRPTLREQLEANWQKIKEQEKEENTVDDDTIGTQYAENTYTTTATDGIPVSANDEQNGNNFQREVYQSLSGFKSDNQRWYENNNQKDNFIYVQDEYEDNSLVNDCTKSERYTTFVDNLKQPDREGMGYHFSDQATNSGISQRWYDNFRTQNPLIAQYYPPSVKDLTQEQVDNLYCQGFYKPLHIETINDDFIAEHVFDIGVNIGEHNGAPIVQKAYNDLSQQNISTTGGVGTETISAINNVQGDDLVRLNNKIVDRRKDYYRSKNNKDYEKGWLGRSEHFRR